MQSACQRKKKPANPSFIKSQVTYNEHVMILISKSPHYLKITPACKVFRQSVKHFRLLQWQYLSAKNALLGRFYKSWGVLGV
jgi:hypothetical protein